MGKIARMTDNGLAMLENVCQYKKPGKLLRNLDRKPMLGVSFQPISFCQMISYSIALPAALAVIVDFGGPMSRVKARIQSSRLPDCCQNSSATRDTFQMRIDGIYRKIISNSYKRKGVVDHRFCKRISKS
jgi:hypothetical protein